MRTVLDFIVRASPCEARLGTVHAFDASAHAALIELPPVKIPRCCNEQSLRWNIAIQAEMRDVSKNGRNT